MITVRERRLGTYVFAVRSSFCRTKLRERKEAYTKAQLIIIASAAFLLVSSIASAQEGAAAGAEGQEAPTAKMTGQDMMGHMGQGMGQRMMGHGMMRQGTMGQGTHMRVMMILMDSDGDGALSLEEVQTAHAKIFKAVDANKDGKVTFEEMEIFFRGGSPTMGR